MKFEKWQAPGNDYVIIEAASLPWKLSPGRIRRICDFHSGIGSDGILLISRTEDPRYVPGLRIFNPDGSEAELSGNGVREPLSSGTGACDAAIAAFLRGSVSPITVELDGGELVVELTPDLEVTLSGWAESVLTGEFSPDLRSASKRFTTDTPKPMKEQPWP